MSALSHARRSICATHKELSLAQGHIGLGAVAIVADGASGPKPPADADLTPMARHLRPVRGASEHTA
jgi:hypothetical protein